MKTTLIIIFVIAAFFFLGFGIALSFTQKESKAHNVLYKATSISLGIELFTIAILGAMYIL